jgi:hypothetical protein
MVLGKTLNKKGPPKRAFSWPTVIYYVIVACTP